MGSDLRYNLINSFRTIDLWRANILFNMGGVTVPGFRKRDITLGVKSSDTLLIASQAPNSQQGSQLGVKASSSELVVQGYRLSTKQYKPNFQAGNLATNLSIVGEGFFAVAESLSPGARVFYTRDGSFSWKKVGEEAGVPRYQLVNSQGLYVMRAQDLELDKNTGRIKLKSAAAANADPPLGLFLSRSAPGQRDGEFTDASRTIPGRITGLLGETQYQGDLSKLDAAQLARFYNMPTDHDSSIAIVKIPNAPALTVSSYGAQIFDIPAFARSGVTVDSLAGWHAREGAASPHLLPYSLEEPDSRGMLQLLEQESLAANYVFQNLSTFMQDYNKGIDELLGIIR